MVRLAVVVVSFMLLGGCANKQAKALMKIYQDRQPSHGALLKTEKALFQDRNGETRLSVVATYLYRGDDQTNDAKGETFIVGLYGDEPDIDDWEASGIVVTLDGKKPLSVKPIDPNDQRLKTLSFVTDWGAYYLVSFPHSRTGLMHFDVTFDGERKAMIFSKRAKYIYTKKAFE